ncbi:hypothetical protein M758_4G260000 [Ceratodon purpureus]|nr:hypothetical protein M758_4G260000 [Ceratodon purpureus]
MPKMGQMDEVKWSVVCIPLVVFMVVTAVTFWSMATIPQQRALHLIDLEAVDQGGAATIYLNIDCDVCVVVYTGDDGSAKPSKTNLPFPLVSRLFQTANKIKKPAQREKIVCVGVDNPVIPCRMARDEFGPNVNCWGFEHMYTQIPTPVRCNHMVMGNTSQYLPQLVTFENQTSGNFTWQQRHVVELDTIAPHTKRPALKEVRPTIVTGFSANHLTIGLLLLRSIAKAALDVRETKPEFAISVVVWEMDEFRGKDRDDMQCVVREIKEKSGVDVEV